MIKLETSLSNIHDNKVNTMVSRFIKQTLTLIKNNSDDNETINKILKCYNLAMRFCNSNQSDNVIYCEGNSVGSKLSNKTDTSEHAWIVCNGIPICIKSILGSEIKDKDMVLPGFVNNYSLNLSAVTSGSDFRRYSSIANLRSIKDTIPIGGITKIVK